MAVRVSGHELSEFGAAAASRAREAQLESLYRAHARRVRALARRRLGDAELAEDAVQETFLNAYRGLDTLDPARPAWPWLARIAGNVCVDLARHRQCRPDHDSLDLSSAAETATAHGVDPAAQYFASESRRDIAAALGGVCPRQRRVLMLREVEGWRYEDIAVLEGMSLDALKGAMKRARQSFRKAYAAALEAGGALGVAVSPRRAWRWLRLRAHEVGARVQESTGSFAAWSAGPLIQVSGLVMASATLAAAAVTLAGGRAVTTTAPPPASGETASLTAAMSRATTTSGAPSAHAAPAPSPAPSAGLAVGATAPPVGALPPVGARAGAARPRDPDYYWGGAFFLANTPVVGLHGQDVDFQIRCSYDAAHEATCNALEQLPTPG